MQRDRQHPRHHSGRDFLRNPLMAPDSSNQRRRQRRRGPAALLAALLLCLSMTALPTLAETATGLVPAEKLLDGEVIRFNDPVVERVIRKTLEKETGDVTRADMATVTEFVCDDFVDPASINDVIADISVLQFCKNLEIVTITRQPITSIEALRGLPLLREVDLSFSESVTDLSPLEGKQRLFIVQIVGLEGVRDLTPVLSLPNLRTFTAGSQDKDTRLDLSPLRGKDTLEQFLYSGFVEDYAPLESHTKMRNATLVGVDREMFATLIAAWPDLRRLTVQSSPLTNEDLSLLSGHAMRDLGLWSCPEISDLSALSGQKALMYLHIWNCSITDITPLRDLQALTRVNLQQNDIRDLSPLKGLPKLETLLVTESDAYTEADIAALLPGVEVLMRPSSGGVN